MRLSKNFTLVEFTKSSTAVRLGIDNTPSQEVIENLRLLVDVVLQPLADGLKKPITVNSGYRSPKLNAAIGGATNSQHVLGLAADIEVAGMSNYDLAVYIRDNLKFDQLILEFYTPGDPSSGWVHVSVSRKNFRQEVLTIGNTIRKFGLYA